MTEYQSPDDMRYAKKLIAGAPAEADAFFKLKAVTERGDGVIPAKYRELIALAVALTTQCSYCLDSHTRNAAKAGATHAKRLPKPSSWQQRYAQGEPWGTAC